jgi:hypothetical protein
MFYIDVVRVIFGSGEYDEYTVRVANNGEATALIEAGSNTSRESKATEAKSSRS